MSTLSWNGLVFVEVYLFTELNNHHPEDINPDVPGGRQGSSCPGVIIFLFRHPVPRERFIGMGFVHALEDVVLAVW